MTETFPALLLRQEEGEPVRASLEEIGEADLPAGDVLVRVTHSSLNYKDGLAVTGRGKIARRLPMVAGIDLAGRVERSDSPDWSPGDPVLATGWGLGEDRFGGYARYARVEASMLTRIPEGLDAAGAMGYGTAGFTAMLAVLALEERGIRPADGPIAVTGAGGGVGSTAVALLARAGYPVLASTGREPLHGYLRSLGATGFLAREELDREAKPMESERFAGAIDSVGGRTLATLAAQIRRGGAISVCGNAGGFRLETTVFPLILRGVALLGIDSNYCPRLRRQAAWSRLARDLGPEFQAAVTRTISLADVPRAAEEILAGRIRGRTVVSLG